MRALALVLVLAVLSACSSNERAPYYAPAREGITLRVVNYGGGQPKIRVNGRLVGTIDASRDCLLIDQSYYREDNIVFEVDPGAGEPSFYLPRINPYTSAGWEVTIDMWTTNRYNQAITLRPAERCEVD